MKALQSWRRGTLWSDSDVYLLTIHLPFQSQQYQSILSSRAALPKLHCLTQGSDWGADSESAGWEWGVRLLFWQVTGRWGCCRSTDHTLSCKNMECARHLTTSSSFFFFLSWTTEKILSISLLIYISYPLRSSSAPFPHAAFPREIRLCSDLIALTIFYSWEEEHRSPLFCLLSFAECLYKKELWSQRWTGISSPLTPNNKPTSSSELSPIFEARIIVSTLHHFLVWVDTKLEKAMAPHSSVLAWRIPGTVEPGGLPSMGSHRVGHDWSDLAAAGTKLMKVTSSLVH